jgi:hypothetical protein
MKDLSVLAVLVAQWQEEQRKNWSSCVGLNIKERIFLLCRSATTKELPMDCPLTGGLMGKVCLIGGLVKQQNAMKNRKDVGYLSNYCKIAEERLEAVDTGVPVKEARKGQKALFELAKQ